MAKPFVVGLDVGNYDTKTQNTVTGTQLKEADAYSEFADAVITFEGKKYTISSNEERIGYVQDKRTDEHFILSLIGIAKEMLFSASRKTVFPDEIQAKIDEYTYVDLGIGLPPGDAAQLQGAYKAFYKEKFKDGVEFSFYGKAREGVEKAEYHFNLKLAHVYVFLQDLMAALNSANLAKKSNDPEYLTNKFRDFGYVAIDIGGFTVDVVKIEQDKPVTTSLNSLDLGVLKFCEQEMRMIRANGYSQPKAKHVLDMLNNKNVPYKPEIKETIKADAQKWVDEILSSVRQMGYDAKDVPVLFLGGGSLLFKDYIKASNSVREDLYTIQQDSRANAIAYAAYTKFMIKNEAQKAKVLKARKQR